MPQLRDDEILVRVRCVALNPNDFKVLDMSPVMGATLGCDFSGDVVRIGPEVKMATAEGLLQLGDRVCGFVYGNHPNRLDNGAFAEFVAVPGDLVYRLPANLSYAQAATIPVGLSTVGLALCHQWKLPFPHTVPAASTSPFSKPQYVLIYGGNTATGTLAIQMVRRSGLVPICTCSPAAFTRAKALGAPAAFDYQSPTCGKEIRRFTENTLAFAFDCITTTASMRCCYEALGTTGSDTTAPPRRYLGLEPFPLREHTRRDVKPEYILTFTLLGAAVGMPRPFGRPARPRDRAFGEAWFKGTQKLIDDLGSEGQSESAGSRLETHVVELGEGGLVGVTTGLDRLGKGDVKGVKLVYEVA